MTPKLTFQLSSAQGVGPPLAVLSNFQLSQTNSISLNYRYSPRLAFNASLLLAITLNAISSFNTPGTGGAGTGINPVAGQFRTRAVQIGASYQVSPFVNAFATYNYFESKNAQAGQTSLSNLYLVGLTWHH